MKLSSLKFYMYFVLQNFSESSQIEQLRERKASAQDLDRSGMIDAGRQSAAIGSSPETTHNVTSTSFHASCNSK